MKKFALALAAATLLSTTAQAGSYAEPKVEAPVIVEDTTSSSVGGEWLVLLLATMVAAVALQ